MRKTSSGRGLFAVAVSIIPTARLMARFFPILALSVVGLFILFIILGSNRSFLVEARTDGVVIAFGDGQNVWRLPDATLCLPLEIPSLKPDPICGQAAKQQGDTEERIIDWPSGAIIKAVAEEHGGMRIFVEKGLGSELPSGGMIVMSKEAWKSTGALTFRAAVTIGQDMQTGSAHYLHEGRWEARESGKITSLFRTLTEVVKSGTFSTGSKVTILTDGTPSRVYGHIVPASASGLSVTMISELGDTALSIRHFGLDDPIIVSPDWIDVAISSPLLLAMAVLFSVLASVSQIFSDTSPPLPRRSSKTSK